MKVGWRRGCGGCGWGMGAACGRRCCSSAICCCMASCWRSWFSMTKSRSIVWVRCSWSSRRRPLISMSRGGGVAVICVAKGSVGVRIGCRAGEEFAMDIAGGSAASVASGSGVGSHLAEEDLLASPRCRLSCKQRRDTSLRSRSSPSIV